MRHTVSRFALLVALSAMPAVASANTDVGVVGMLEGTASAKNAAGAAHALKTGDTVYIDEEIATGTSSKLQLMLKDKSSIMLNANSNLKVREFAFNADTQDGKLAVDELKGAFRFIGGALSKKNPVMIKTPVSSIGIRGGVNDTFVQPNGATDAVFIYGQQMDMTNADGNTVSTTSFGSGLAMQTPNDLPQTMSPQQVDQHLTTFASPKPVDSTSNNTSSNDQKPTEQTAAGGDKKADGDQASSGEQKSDNGQTQSADNSSGDQKANGDSKSDGGQNQAGPGGDKNGGNGGGTGGDGNGKRADGTPGNGGNQGGQGTPGGRFESDQPQTLKSASGPQNPAPGAPIAPPGNTTSQSSNDTSRTAAIVKLVGNDPATLAAVLKDPNQFSSQLQTVIQNQAAGSTQTLGDTIKNAAAPQLDGVLIINNDNVGVGTFVKRVNDLRFIRGTATGGGSIFSGTAVDRANNSTDSSSIPAPSAGQRGFFDYGNTTINGSTYTGFAFITDSGSTTFQQFTLNGTVPGTTLREQVSMIIGDKIKTDVGYNAAIASTLALSNGQGTNNISFYRFLPELTNYAGGTNAGTGYFDPEALNAANPNFASNNGSGVAINWQKKQFLSGSVDWENTAGAPLNRNAIVAFGNVGSNTSAPAFEGVSFESAQQGTRIDFDNSTTISAGIASQNNLLFKNAADGSIEAVVLEGTKYGVPSNQASLEQAAVRINPASNPQLTSVDSTSATGITNYKGFSAGFVVNENASVFNPAAFQTLDINDLAITTDNSTNTVSADITMRKAFDTLNPSHPEFIKLKFGGASSPNAQSVYLSNDLYAANNWQTEYSSWNGSAYVVDQTVTGIDPTVSTSNNGFIVNATAFNDLPVAQQCASCDYVHWGVWSTDITRANGNGPAAVVDHANMVAYVAGQVTQNIGANLPSTGTYTYTGPIYGQVYDAAGNGNAGAITRSVGNFTSSIDLANRQLSGFNGSLGSYTITSSGVSNIQITGDAVTTTPLNISLGGGFTGTLNAALYGPNAENIGGDFAAKNTPSTLQATGVFLGNR